jgi:hypothetical protein
MPNNASFQPNPTQALIEAGINPENTLQAASNASAARFIDVLRDAYPEIDMQTQSNETTQLPEKIASIITAQEQLQNILREHIHLLSSAEPETHENSLQELTMDVQSSIQGTLNMITHIKALKTDSRESISQVFAQMLAIARVCPGIQWSTNARHWCLNPIYDAINNTLRIVIASPAETLNLVCRAILDPARYPNKMDDATNANKDQQHRIHSFFRSLLALYQSQQDPQREKCTGGIQHDLLNLLSHSYHDKPCSHPDSKPIVWINDTTTFIYEKLTTYVSEQLREFSNEGVIIDWIKFQVKPSADSTDEIHPLISFLRATDVVEGEDPDAAWKRKCELYLSQHCIAIGLCPDMCHLVDMINAITSLPPPALEGGLTAMMFQLMEAQSIEVSNGAPLSRLIEARNQSILSFQTKIDKAQWDFLKPAVPHLFLAEEWFQLLFQDRQLLPFIDETTDAVQIAFKAAIIRLETTLMTFYEAQLIPTLDSQPLLNCKIEYLQQSKIYKTHFHVDYIESYFKTLNLATYEPGADPFLRQLEIMNDATLQQWNKYQKSVQNCFDLTHMGVYEVNRLLLHALSTPSSEWSERFCLIMPKLTRSLMKIESKTNPKIAELKRFIPKPLLDNLALIACFRQSDSEEISQSVLYSADNGAVKKILSSTLISTLSGFEKTQFVSIFKFLLERKADIFISHVQLIDCLKLNLSNDQQNQLMKTIPRNIYEHAAGIINLFKLSTNQLSHEARERILVLMRNRLNEIIPQIFIPLFLLPKEQLSQLERKMLFNPEPSDPTFISYNFNSIISMHYQLEDLFSRSMEELSATQRDAILKSLEPRLSIYFRDFGNIFSLFRLDMGQLSAENRNTIFLQIQGQLAQMPTDGWINLFYLSLEQLTPGQRDAILKSLEPRLPMYIRDFGNIFSLFRLNMRELSAENRNTIFQQIQGQLAQMPTDGWFNLFSLSLEQLTPGQRESILETGEQNRMFSVENADPLIQLLSVSDTHFPEGLKRRLVAENKENLKNIITKASHISSLIALSHDRHYFSLKDIWDAVSDKLTTLDINGNTLGALLALPITLFTEEKRKEFCLQIVSRISQIIQTSDAFLNLFNLSLDAFSEQNREVIFKALQPHFQRFIYPDFKPSQARITEAKILQIQEEDLSDYYASVHSVNLCMILELPEDKLNPDARAFLCDTFIEHYIQNTVRKIIELKAKITPYSPLDSNKEDKLGFMKEESFLFRRMMDFFTAELNARLLNLSDKQITKGAREQLVQLFFKCFNRQVTCITNIYKFLDLSLLQFTEEQRRTLVQLTIEQKKSLISDGDNLVVLFRLPIEKLSHSLRHEIITNSHLGMSIESNNLMKLGSLFESLSVENRVFILSRIFEKNPNFSRPSNMPHRLVEMLRKELSDSELPVKLRIHYWNKIRPLSGNDFPRIPGSETYLGRAIVSQHYQAALDCVFNGEKIEKTDVVYDTGEIVDGLAYLDDLILFDEKISPSLRQDLETFKDNLILAEQLTFLKQNLEAGQRKYPRRDYISMPNIRLSKYRLDNIIDMQHVMIQEPLKKHPAILTFIQHSAETDIVPLAITPSIPIAALIYAKHSYNGIVLSHYMKTLQKKSQAVSLDLASTIGAQLMLSLAKIRCLGGSVFGYIRSENIIITPDNRVLIDANLVLKHRAESDLNSDAVLMRRIGKMIYEIACPTCGDDEPSASLSLMNITDEPLRLFLEKVLHGDLKPSCILDLFFSFPHPVISIGSLKGPLNERMEKIKTLEGNENALREKEVIQTELFDLLRPLQEDLEKKLETLLSYVPPMSIDTSWFKVMKDLSPKVKLITIISEEKRRWCKVAEASLHVLKELEISGDPTKDGCLRRAVTILERSHHPNIINMKAATREGNQVSVLLECAEVGSLSHVLSNYPQAQMGSNSYIDFLLAVTCQVLNGLLFLNHRLSVNHKDITPDNILFFEDGRIKLSGFNARARQVEPVLCDMKQLSKLLHSLLPTQHRDEADYIKAARVFADYLATKTPDEALSHKAMIPFYNDKNESSESIALKEQLKRLDVEGKTPVEELRAWKNLEDKNPTTENRHAIRRNIKELSLHRIIEAAVTVKEAIKYIPLQCEPDPLDRETESALVTELAPC